MPHNQAANLVALRNAIEEMTISVANHPDIILNPTENHGRLGALVRALCRSNAGRFTENSHVAVSTGSVHSFRG